MHSKTVQLSKKECVEEVIELFFKDKDITIKERSESKIEFERHSIWTGGFVGRSYPYLLGKLQFEGNGKTTIMISYRRGFQIILYWLVIALWFISYLFLEILHPSFFQIVPIEPFDLAFLISILLLGIILYLIAIIIMNRNEKNYSNKIFSYLEKLSLGEKEYTEYFEPERVIWIDWLVIVIVLVFAIVMILVIIYY